MQPHQGEALCGEGGAEPRLGARVPSGAGVPLAAASLLYPLPLQTPVDEKEAQSVPNIEYLLPNIGRTAAPGDAAGEQQCPWHRPPQPGHWGTPGHLSSRSLPSTLTPLRAASLAHRGHSEPVCAGAGHLGTLLSRKQEHPLLGAPACPPPHFLLSPPSLVAAPRPSANPAGHGAAAACRTPAHAHCPAPAHAASSETGRL